MSGIPTTLNGRQSWWPITACIKQPSFQFQSAAHYTKQLTYNCSICNAAIRYALKHCKKLYKFYRSDYLSFKGCRQSVNWGSDHGQDDQCLKCQGDFTVYFALSQFIMALELSQHSIHYIPRALHLGIVHITCQRSITMKPDNYMSYILHSIS
jgi:hypothetical protein